MSMPVNSKQAVIKFNLTGLPLPMPVSTNVPIKSGKLYLSLGLDFPSLKELLKELPSQTGLKTQQHSSWKPKALTTSHSALNWVESCDSQGSMSTKHCNLDFKGSNSRRG